MAMPHSSISKLLSPISSQLLNTRRSLNRSTRFAVRSYLGGAASSAAASQHSKKKKEYVKVRRAPRHLITVSTSGATWQDQWSCEYMFSLRELQLADLAEDGQKDAQVSVRLTIQKHASFGFSVVGRIVTSFNRKCSCCSSSYCREIDTTFDVWVLSSRNQSERHMTEIGGNDPSVIYVKPGSQADLDSTIQDTIRLTASVTDTCSESCEKSTIIWQCTEGKREYDKRWHRLLELRDAM